MRVIMKKVIIAFVCGVVVATAGSAYADDIKSIVGMQIQGEFPVKVSGKQLDTKAAVLDGTSYLPVRAIGEALNMEVSFDADLGIELKAKEGNVLPEKTKTPEQEALIEESRKISEKLKKSLDLQNKQRELDVELGKLGDPVRAADHEKATNPNYEYDAAYYTNKKTYEAKQAEYQELTNQLAELQK